VKAIVGLGNPGSQYKGTRHNVGFDVVDGAGAARSVGFESAPAEALIANGGGRTTVVLLVKPLTFMNLSGQAVGELARYFKIESPTARRSSTSAPAARQAAGAGSADRPAGTTV
jgi:PTH1 family peptidyl-tRNA hydrolase